LNAGSLGVDSLKVKFKADLAHSTSKAFLSNEAVSDGQYAELQEEGST